MRSGSTPIRSSHRRKSWISPGSELMNCTCTAVRQGFVLAPSHQYAATPATNSSLSASDGTCAAASAIAVALEAEGGGDLRAREAVLAELDSPLSVGGPFDHDRVYRTGVRESTRRISWSEGTAATLTVAHGFADQEAPQAHAEEKAQEDA